ncbi:unnamed protein product [Penicillium roqueforti FM164]|uniref:Genomic scaffold, ProqFM164S02 n=1 Tax=Penicillium roqueforti (strain FM164) TaxID=1365484 RepID=W6QK23_PENRF|nr:unnamed protein product [Penicillium roqueforti FM164]
MVIPSKDYSLSSTAFKRCSLKLEVMLLGANYPKDSNRC